MILKFLDCSTRHLHKGTVANLKEYPFLCRYAEGFIVTVPDEVEMEDMSMPEDLKAVLAYARTKECDLVRFDNEADTVSGLAFYPYI